MRKFTGMVLVLFALLVVSPVMVNAQDCPAITVAAPQDVQAGAYPQQYELAEFEALAGCTLSFSENPNMAALNAEITGNPAELEPVEDRLPAEPLVVVPYEEIGVYGGTINGISQALESGTSGILSWRHVNLVRFSDDLQTIVPNIARDWAWNDDFTEITFFLREGHRWSDGQPFTAEDIDFWYNDNKRNEAIFAQVESVWVFGGEPMTVEMIDATTVSFGFAVPNPNFLTFLATTWRQPFQPKHFLSPFHIDYNENANELAQEAGFDSWVEYFSFLLPNSDWKDAPTPLIRDETAVTVPTLESYITIVENSTERRFVANPYFHMVDTAGNQLPYPDRIQEDLIADREIWNLRIIEGQVDLKNQGLELADFPLYAENTENGNFSLQLIPTGGARHLTYTLNYGHQDAVLREIFNDVRFRQALSVAINREEVNELIYLGQGAPIQWLPADHTAHPYVTDEQLQNFAQYDPELANSLLDEMGLTERAADGTRLRPDGQPLVLNLEYALQAGSPEVHELMREYWGEVGVRLELQELQLEVWRERSDNNEHDLAAWHGDGTSSPGLASGVLNNRTVPPFREGYVVEWGDWLFTDGAEGIEPPADAQRVFELVEELALLPIGSEAAAEVGREIVQLHVDNLWLIGIVGDVAGPMVVHNNMGNVTTHSFRAFDYYWNLPYRPFQWFLRADS
ncbi:MAG: ABC transporter substrate-binding protein [Chloroflexi bacterium]|nr:ABC transporter substrate-binding protein [Chloroflexota bacterium]